MSCSCVHASYTHWPADEPRIAAFASTTLPFVSHSSNSSSTVQSRRAATWASVQASDATPFRLPFTMSVFTPETWARMSRTRHSGVAGARASSEVGSAARTSSRTRARISRYAAAQSAGSTLTTTATDGLLRRRHADRAREAGATEPAVAVRVRGEVLLVIRLGVVEGPGLHDLGGDVAEAGVRQHLLEHVARVLGG